MDKNIFILSLFYALLAVFFAIALIIPFRVVFELESYFMNPFYYYDYSSFFLISSNLRIIMSRGIIAFLPGLGLFVVSMILFLKFSNRGDSNMAKIGFILCICSAGLVLLSAFINYIVYSNRIITYAPILITIGIGLTQLNIGSIIFTKRNDLEAKYPRYGREVYDYKKAKDIEPKLPIREKTIPIMEKKPTKSEVTSNFCPFCGMQVEKDHNFCRKCGKTLHK